jgi:hypothetical protein
MVLNPSRFGIGTGLGGSAAGNIEHRTLNSEHRTEPPVLLDVRRSMFDVQRSAFTPSADSRTLPDLGFVPTATPPAPPDFPTTPSDSSLTP